MGWDREKTLKYLKLLVLLSIILATISIALVSLAIVQHSEDMVQHFTTSLVYLIATTYGTGYGCIWFRMTQGKFYKFHSFIHAATFLLMIIGHREIFQLCWHGEFVKSYNLFPISILTISTYLIQFLFTIYLEMTKYGGTPHKKAQSEGMHAFLGAIILFICVADGLLLCHRVSRDLTIETEIPFHFASICVFFYGMTIWYIMLNPYFDYRRLAKRNS